MEVVQAMVTRHGDVFVAESVAPAARCEADSIDAALARLEDELRRMQPNGDRFYLVASLYLGPIVETD